MNFEIEYTVPRFKSPIGEIVLEEDLPDCSEDEYEPISIRLNVSGFCSFERGQYYGAPENCFPDDYQCELISILYKNKEFNDLTSGEVEDIERLVFEKYFIDV